jgi:hypothetical protein
MIVFILFTQVIEVKAQTIFDREYFFDDFKYEKITYPAKSDSSKSMFGTNPWLKKNGVEYTSAWRRYSFEDPDYFGKKMQLTFDSIGFNLTLQKNFDKSVGYLPTVNSNFLISEGTIAARIKFPEMKSGDKMNHAFFLWSPVFLMFEDFEGSKYQPYWAEMDFEFNNCFYKDDEARLKIGCNNYDGKYIRDRSIDCIVRKDGKYLGFKDCAGEYEGKDLISDNWLIYIFRINKLENKIEFAIASDDKEMGFELWAGHTYNTEGWGKFAFIDNYFPQYLLETFFTVGLCNEATKDHTISVDWFFYSPKPDLSHSEIINQVGELKSQNIPRINTTKLPVYVEVAEYAKDNLAITGPTITQSCNMAKWEISPMYKGRHFYRIKYDYRITTGDKKSEWIKIERPEFYYTPKANEDKIEIRLIYRDEWQTHIDTINYFCDIEKINCEIFKRDIYFHSIIPNPGSDNIISKIEMLSEGNLTLDIIDPTGRIIKTVYNGLAESGTKDIEVNISELSQGVYFIRARTAKITEDRMFVKIE